MQGISRNHSGEAFTSVFSHSCRAGRAGMGGMDSRGDFLFRGLGFTDNTSQLPITDYHA